MHLYNAFQLYTCLTMPIS